MILVDVNLLIYAQVTTFPQHQRARHWFDAQLDGPSLVGLPWESLLAFLRIITNPRVFEKPEPITTAWSQVLTWLSNERVWIPQPTERHVDIFGELLSELGVGGKLVPDVHLAALAIEHDLILCSTDGDFQRFSKLRWQNPIL